MTITFQTIGLKTVIIYTHNGVEITRENFDQNHPFWGFDWDNIGRTEQQAIRQYTGYTVPLSGTIQTLLQAKNYVDNQIAAKKPEFPSGLGASVTQLTSKSTPVTINTIYGLITTHAAALAAGAEVTFTVNNSLLGANEFVHVGIKGGGTIGAYDAVRSSSQAGSFTITLSNKTTGSLSQAIIIDFYIVKII